MNDTPDSPATPPATEPGAAAAAAQATELVAFADCELVGINGEMTLAIHRLNGNQQIMAPQVVEGLTSCTSFATVPEHAALLAASRPELAGQQAMAATALNGLLETGMLLRAGDVCARLAEPTPRQLPPTRVFIITCDRPAAVERLLESMLRAGNLSPHNALFLVDDSRDPANRAANEELVARFNLRSAKDMFYVGEQAQHTLLSGLLEQLPAHGEGIRFLLDSPLWQGKKTYGRSRTLCLLLSVGYRALVMDDDILCQAILPPVTEAGIGIGSGGMRKAAFFASEQEVMNSGPRADFDPLSGHASLLGTSLGQALHSLNDGPLAPPQLRGVNAAMANVLRADSPVLVTQCGTLGDPGAGGAHWGMVQEPDTVARLLAAPHGMTAALENRLNWLGSSRPNIYKMPFMSQLTGLDNSRLLPPYFPAFRGEDVLFGAMLVATHHDSVALEYPWSVPHLPLETRHFSLAEPIANTGGIALFARYLTERVDYNDRTAPEHNLHQLAREALRMAGRSDADLLLDYRTELARAQSEQLRILTDKFARAQQLPSAEWQAYLRRGIEEVQQALASPQSPTCLRGLPEGATEATLLPEFRELARGFAASLQGWADMRTVAATLTDEMVSSKQLLPR